MFGLNKNLFISEVTIQYKVSEDITCLINDALIKTYLLERERGNSGRNRTIKMIISYKTKTPKHRETEGEGKEEREREGKSEWIQPDYSSSILQLRISKVKVRNVNFIRSYIFTNVNTGI